MIAHHRLPALFVFCLTIAAGYGQARNVLPHMFCYLFVNEWQKSAERSLDLHGAQAQNAII